MSADTRLGIEGKDVSISLTMDGAPVAVSDQVESFSREPVYDAIEVKPLGTTERRLDQVPTGWKGEMEVVVATPAMDELLDQYHAARRNRVPAVLNIREVIHYRDGQVVTYVYPDVALMGAPRDTKRGEKSLIRLSWETGRDRIAS